MNASALPDSDLPGSDLRPPVQQTAGPSEMLAAPWLPADADPVPEVRKTVLVVDPVGAAREVLHPALIEHAGCQIVYTRTVLEFDDVISTGLMGELALVSLHLELQAPRVIRTLRTAGWGRVMALTTSGMPISPIIEAFVAGASGVVSIAGGGPPDPHHPARQLSSREVEVVRLVADGCSNKEIGRRLVLSPLTVKNHLSRIGRKFGVGDRAHIVAVACRGGVIPGFAGPGAPLYRNWG